MNYIEDEGGPLEAAFQEEAFKPPSAAKVKSLGGERDGKGSARRGQVSAMESNASEPLKTCRKRSEDVKTEGVSLTRDKFGSNLIIAQVASGMKKART